ncbi:MAG TPA: hypothetical protein VL593_06965 [Ramlibacter sp.]|jgi:hypothetical protein|nr:hypothetical protein [Ramlibacter sp.]
MAGRPRNVDLGPVYLQVGEDAGPKDAMPSDADANVRDVARFDSLMRRADRQRDEADIPAEALLDPLRAPQVQHLAQADDIGNEVARLWVGTGMHSGREVRVGLREALLPDTSVRLFEADGRVRIEFTCGTSRVADWLDRKLAELARSIGERLQRPLELAVYMAGGNLVGTNHWPEDA